MPRLVLFTTLLVVVLPWELLAQESRPFGLVFGVPAHVGVVWQASKRLAIRPDVSFSWASTETTSELSIGLAPGGVQSSIVTRSRTESTAVAVGLSALISVGEWDRVRAYLGPRVTYEHISASIETTRTLTPPLPPSSPPIVGLPAGQEDQKITNDDFSVAGLFGAQYTPTARFAVFGESGVAYATPDLISPSPIATTRRTVSLTGRVGVVFFF
jgi:hypothetical protein